jgi:hypothetical protein
VENYPELKANENVLQLQEQLTTTENQISFARQHYNATVLDYNTAIVTIPSNLIAGPLGFTRRDFFDAEPAAEAVPAVDLGFPPGGGAPASGGGAALPPAGSTPTPPPSVPGAPPAP